MRNINFGSEVERMKELMKHGENDAKLRSNVSETVEYKTKAPDGKTYGIVRERMKYFIKESVDDGSTFSYIGGAGNKSDYEYPSYNSASRNLELKIRSINENLNTGNKFELLPADTTSEYIVEATQDMRNEIDRQRQIMMGVAKIMNESTSFINKPKFKDPESFGTATDPKKQGAPFTDDTKASLDKDPSFKATDPKKQGAPFVNAAKGGSDKVKTTKDHVGAGVPFTDKAEDVLGGSVATKKVGAKDFSSKHKASVKESMYEEEEVDLDSYDEDGVDDFSYGDDSEDLFSTFGDMFRPEDYTKEYVNEYDDYEEDEEFVPHGSYTVSNSGGYEVMIDSGRDMAKVRDAYGSDNPQVSDWLKIVDVETDEVDSDGYPEIERVIDPDGYNIPLSQVMRVREAKSLNHKKMIREFEDFDYELDFYDGDGDDEVEKEPFPTPSKVRYVGDNSAIASFFNRNGGVVDYVGQTSNPEISYVMAVSGRGSDEKKVPTADLERVPINEGVWDSFKAIGSVGKHFGSKAKDSVVKTGKGVANKASELGSKVSGAVGKLGHDISKKAGDLGREASTVWNASKAQSSQAEVDRIANMLKKELTNLNDRTIKSGGAPLNYNSVLMSLSNKLRGQMRSVKNEGVDDDTMIDEDMIGEITEAVLSSFGKHHQYQKPAFTTPAGGENKPYGQKIGNSAPFTKQVKQNVGQGEIGEDGDEVIKGKTQKGVPSLGKSGDNAPFVKGVQKNGKEIAKGTPVQQGKAQQAKPELGKSGDKSPFNKSPKKAVDINEGTDNLAFESKKGKLLNSLAESIISDLKKKL